MQCIVPFFAAETLHAWRIILRLKKSDRYGATMRRFSWISALITTSVLMMAFLAAESAPLWFNRLEGEPDKSQNKCNPELNGIRDPRLIPRPDDSLKIIRLTNSGEFVSRCELTNALYEVNWDRKFPEEARMPVKQEGAVSQPKLVLLYIHGWKHSADRDDSDLYHFDKLVQRLRKQYADRRRVVGVYIGWNADSGFWPWFEPLENLTFWVKKNNADRIAQSAAVTMIVSSIGAMVKSDPTRQDEFIAVGHSFGARILYSATAQSLVSAAERAHPGHSHGTYSVFEGVADAVILLNPAFEASRYSTINDFSRNDEHFDRRQPPLLITIASEADRATKYAFPVGQYLGLARSSREKHTLGNYNSFQTHRLNKMSREQCSPDGDVSSFENFYAANLCLRRIPPRVETVTRYSGEGETQQYNPFIVARTDQSIIADHNDIWNSDFRHWLAAIIERMQVKHEDAPKTIEANNLRRVEHGLSPETK